MGPSRVTLLIVTAAVVAGGGAAAAKSVKGPTNDSFEGHIAHAGGSLSGDRGRMAIVLQPGVGSAKRTVRITITGRRCKTSATHCARLTGTLTGTMTRQPTLADIGAQFVVKATGRVEPLGHVSAEGSAHGTGFIARGEETLRLRLETASGSVTVDAHSATVPGFTSP